MLQVYAQKLGVCLLGAIEESNDPVTLRMDKCAAEAMSAMICMNGHSPRAVRAFNAAVDPSSLLGGTSGVHSKGSDLMVSFFLCTLLLHLLPDCLCLLCG